MSTALKLNAINAEDFEFFCKMVADKTGITITSSKTELLQARLRPRLQELGLADFAEYRAILETLPSDHPEWQSLINQITTNKTDFFREADHFTYLVDVFIPEWLKTNAGKTLNIWCAACSTGEEPYTITMAILKKFGPEFKFKMLATDIDTEVLATAKNGVYNVEKLAPIPPDVLKMTFIMGTGEISQWAKVRPEIKKYITFDQFNLKNSTFEFAEKFDVIFCRNVMIYFSSPLITQIVQNFYTVTNVGGVLFTGHSESLTNEKTKWLYNRPSVYRKWSIS